MSDLLTQWPAGARCEFYSGLRGEWLTGVVMQGFPARRGGRACVTMRTLDWGPRSGVAATIDELEAATMLRRPPVTLDVAPPPTAPLRTGVEWVDLQLADLHGDADRCSRCAAPAAVVMARRGEGGEWWADPRCAGCVGEGRDV